MAIFRMEVIHSGCLGHFFMFLTKEQEETFREYEPLLDNHPAVGVSCPVCKQTLEPGDRTRLIPKTFIR